MEILGLHAKISGDTSELKESLEAGKEALQEFGINVDKIKQFLTGGAGLALAFIEVGKEGIEAASKFAEATQQMGRATGVLGPQLNEMTAQLHEVMASGVEQSVGDIGQAMSQLTIRFHVSGEELTDLTKTFAEFADINNIAVGPAVEKTSKVIAKFGLDVSETEPLLDKLTYTSQQTGLSVDSLSQSLVDNGAVFKGANLSINDSISLLAGFEQGGVDSGRAIQGLRTAITGFQKDGEDAGKGLKELIEQIKNTKDANEAAQIAVAHFGRGAQDMLQAIRGGFVDIEGFNAKLEQSEGTLKRTADGTKTAEESMKQLQNQVQNLGAEAFQGLLEFARPVIDVLAVLLKVFESLPAPVKETIEVTGLFLAALKIAQVALAVFGRELTVAFGPIGIITLAITGLVTAIDYLQEAEKRENEENIKAIAHIKSKNDEALKSIGIVNDLNKNNQVSSKTIDELIKLYPELTDKIKLNNLTAEQAVAISKSAAINDQIKLQAKLTLDLAKANEAVAYNQDYANRSFAVYKTVSAGIQEALDASVKKQKDLTERLADSKKALEELITPHDKIKDKTEKLTGSQSSLEKQLAIVNQKLRDQAITFDESYKEKTTLIQAAIDQVTKDGEVTGAYDSKKLANLLSQKNAVQNLIDLKDIEATKDLIHYQEVDDAGKKFLADQQKGVDDFIEKQKKISDGWKEVGETMSGSFRTFGQLASSLTSAIADDFKDAFKDIGKIVQSTLATIGNLMNESFKQQEAMLNAQMANEEAAAGVADQTNVEKAQTALAAAKTQYDGETDATKKAADAQAIIEAEKALKKAQIEEDYQKKITRLQFEQAHAQWVMQGLQILAASALAVTQALTLPPPASFIAAGITGGLTIAEGVVWSNNEPKAPEFARGTDFTPGGMALVGELGPEMVNLPRGSQVINNTKTEQMLSNQSNSATHIHIHNPKESSISDMARALTIQQRKLSHEMRALR